MCQPYTYLIGWKKQKKYYYGVRYAKKCSPDDLWKKYFTSSNSVFDMRSIYGEPDIIKIRKKFANKEEAINWETRVLKKMKVVAREDFLNKNDMPAPPINNRIMSTNTKTKISSALKGKPKSEEHKQKIREARAKQINFRQGVPQSKETKQKIRQANLGKTLSNEIRQKMSDSRRGKKHWNYGKIRSQETKQKLRQANLGKTLSNETRQKMSESKLRKNK